MSKAAKCDRCGQFYLVDRKTNERVLAPDANHVFQQLLLAYMNDSGSLNSDIRYDLCPECRYKLKTWLLNPDI